MPTTQRNRMFSSIQNTDKNHGSFGYSWSDNSVITGSANFITGAWVPLTADASGRLLVAIGDANITGNLSVVLDKTGDSVTAYPPQFTTVSSSTISGSMSAATTGVALPSNTNRKEFYVQVIGSGSPLFLAFNGNSVSSTNLNVMLKAATSSYGADGGLLSNQTYQGPVCVSGGIGCLFTIWEA